MSPQIVLTCFAFSKNWTARIALASQHFGKISDKMEQCLRQKIAGVDEQFCHVVNEIEDGKCDLSRDASFAGDMRDTFNQRQDGYCALYILFFHFHGCAKYHLQFLAAVPMRRQHR